MKVLFVSDYGTPNGGAEIATRILRDGLRARRHETLLFTSSARGTGVPSDADVECFGTTSFFRTLLQSANPWAWHQLGRVLEHFRPDVVHVGMFLTQLSPLILPALRNVPTVFHVHWLRVICPTGFKLRPDDSVCQEPAGLACHRAQCLPLRDAIPLMGQMRLVRRWLRGVDRVVANSAATRAALEAEGFADVDAIPYGVPPPPRRPALADVPTAVFCGRLTRQKGVHVLLDAWPAVVRRIPAARLLIVGDGPERAVLQRRQLSGVSFCGMVPHNEIERVAGPAWIQIVPSIGFEPFGLVAAEGMMRGAPVVATRIGGLPEVVRPEITGKLVPPGDSTVLAKVMVELLLDRAWCEKLGTRAQEVAHAELTADRYVDRFVECFESVIANKWARKDA